MKRLICFIFGHDIFTNLVPTINYKFKIDEIITSKKTGCIERVDCQRCGKKGI